MTLLGIAWRNIRQRLLTSLLTSLSLALGVALVSLVALGKEKTAGTGSVNRSPWSPTYRWVASTATKNAPGVSEKEPTVLAGATSPLAPSA